MIERMTTDGILALVGTGTSTTTTESLADYGLDVVNCDRCNNTGTIVWKDNGELKTRECECMAKRRSIRRIRLSGLSDVLESYTFGSYETPDRERRMIKQKAMDFCKSDSGWFYITGRSGSGKSHICTAICSDFLNRNIEVFYMSWREQSTSLKQNINDAEWYREHIDKLKNVKVLYIDDFLKGGITDADIRLAFEILNYRYIRNSARTIISSEIELKELLSRDEALGGRIYERSKGFVLIAPNENWRLR